MTRIDRYLLREAWPPFAFATMLYATLAIVSATVPRLQWIAGVPLADVGGWLLTLLPQALVQTTPVALVLAVLLTIGRLTTDHELTAAQAGGVPLRRMTGVFMGMAVVAGTVALALNQWLVPPANAAAADVYWRLTAGRSGLFRLAAQRAPIDGFTLRFDRVERDGTLRDVWIERWDDAVYTLIRADRARFDGLDLVLRGHRTQRLDLAALDAPGLDPDARLRALVRLDARAADPDAPLAVTAGVDEAELVARFSGGGFEDPRSLTRLWRDAGDPALSAAERREAAVLGHRKLAEPVSHVALLLAAVPLSVAFARSRSVAFGLALAVTLAWYLCYTFGQLLALGGVVPTWLGPWSANLLLGGAGLAGFAARIARR